MLKLNHLTGFGSGAVAAAAADTPTSYVFDGTGDYLQIPDHADFDFTTGGDFTVELFLRSPDGSAPATEYTLYSHRSSGNDDDLSIVASTGVIEWRINEGGVEVQIFSSGAVLTDNTWHHVALCRDVNDYFIYVDGTDVTSSGSPDSYDRGTGIAGDITIGARNDPAEYFNGYIDEFRISDTCRYPNGTGFTPTITQFTSDANTLLLIHGGEAYTGALTGETTAPCYVFDGTSDQLSLPDHADWDLFADTNNATIDFWVNFSAANGKDMIGQYEDGTHFWRIYTTIGTLKFDLYDSSQVFQCANTKTFVANTWHHVALCKVGIEYGLYIDGTQIAYVSNAGTATFTGGLFFGGHTHVGGDWYDGKMAEMRIYDGNPFTAAPNATPDDTIIVPTERHTSDANTLLLIHGDEAKSGTTGSGATFTDSGNTGHTVTEVGNTFSGNGGAFTDSGSTGHTVSENGNAIRDVSIYKF